MRLKWPRFKISAIAAPLKSALDVDADQHEWSLKAPMPIPAYFRTFFKPPDMMEDTTSLCRLTKVSKSWEHSSTDLQPSVREIY